MDNEGRLLEALEIQQRINLRNEQKLAWMIEHIKSLESKVDSLIPKVEDVRKYKEEIYRALSEGYKPPKNKPTQSGTKDESK